MLSKPRKRQRMIKYIIYIFSFFFTINSFSQTEKFNAEHSEILKDSITEVSIIQLISNPEKYEGKTVQIEGFISLEYEGMAIYLTKDDYEYFNRKNGICLLLSKEDAISLKKECHKKFVTVTGKFQTKLYGKSSAWNGLLFLKRIFVSDSRKTIKHIR